MATREMMKDTLIFLANYWPKKVSDELVNGFYHVLSGFTNEDIYEAGLRYIEAENEYFPTPGKLKKCIPFKVNENKNTGFHLTDYKMRCQVKGCLKIDLCIKEPLEDPTSIYKCRDCYTGLTFQERNQRMRDIMHMIKDKDFKPNWMEG